MIDKKQVIIDNVNVRQTQRVNSKNIEIETQHADKSGTNSALKSGIPN